MGQPHELAGAPPIEGGGAPQGRGRVNTFLHTCMCTHAHTHTSPCACTLTQVHTGSQPGQGPPSAGRYLTQLRDPGMGVLLCGPTHPSSLACTPRPLRTPAFLPLQVNLASPVRCLVVSCPGQKNQGPERLSDLLQVTQSVGGWPRAARRLLLKRRVSCAAEPAGPQPGQRKQDQTPKPISEKHNPLRP